MARQDTLNDIRETMGLVPGWAESAPDAYLEQMWTTMKTFWMVDSAIPSRTKALLGITAAAVMRCRF